MLLSKMEQQKLEPLAGPRFKAGDEHKWVIADEEFEVSSSYSPVENCLPKFLEQ